MSVLKNKRNTAFTEYERAFTELYNLSASRTSKVPKRRKKWISDKIDITMNRASMFVLSTITLYYDEDKRSQISQLGHKAMVSILSLEKPLMILWNIEQYETRKMAAWVTAIRKVLVELNKRTIDKVIENEIPRFMILDWNYIGKAVFCQNMCNLHRYIHGKVTHANCGFDSTHGSQLIELVDSAFYHVMKANERKPTNKLQYDKRRKHLQQAIAALKAMATPSLFYFNIMQYSEHTMREWNNMLASEIKLLRGLQNSDKKMFSDLQ